MWSIKCQKTGKNLNFIEPKVRVQIALLCPIRWIKQDKTTRQEKAADPHNEGGEIWEYLAVLLETWYMIRNEVNNRRIWPNIQCQSILDSWVSTQKAKNKKTKKVQYGALTILVGTPIMLWLCRTLLSFFFFFFGISRTCSHLNWTYLTKWNITYINWKNKCCALHRNKPKHSNYQNWYCAESLEIIQEIQIAWIPTVYNILQRSSEALCD